MSRQALLSCATCEGLDFNVQHKGAIFTMDDCYRSAEKGCPLCKLLRDGALSFYGSLEPFSGFTIFDRHHSSSSDYNSTAPEHVEIRRKYGRYRHPRPQWDVDPAGTLYVLFYTHANSPAIWPAFGVAREPSQDMSSTQCMELANQWMQNCLSNHVKCKQSSVPELPSRVIYVGSEVIQPRLFVTGGQRGEYVVLTWCWGAEVPLTTTTINLEKHVKGIPLDELPQLFRDAILVTRSLGFQYLWIDALCIIQGSKEDWAAESGRMAAVYGNARLTIAADTAINAKDGLFKPDSQLLRRPAVVECPGVDGSKTQMYIRKQCHRSKFGFHYNREPPPHWQSEYEPGTLASRAWCLQENVLSRRLLHYSVTEMSWQCLEAMTCECTPVFKKCLRNEQPGYIMSNGDRNENWFWSEGAEATWGCYVLESTSRKLSNSTDRLAVLSGLAEMRNCVQPDSYYAGIWKTYLEWQLAWHVQYPASSRHAVYHAPSWSWASVTGAIMSGPSRKPDNSIYVELLDIQCTPVGPDRYGAVRDGHIRVKGKIFPAFIYSTTKMDVMRKRAADFAVEGVGSNWCGVAYFDVHSDKAEMKVGPKEYFVLPIGYFSNDAGFGGSLYGFRGLLLRKAQHKDNAFERVGLVRGYQGFDTRSRLSETEIVII